MLPAMALVARGLQMLVCMSVEGTRSSVDRKLSFRKSSARAISRIGRRKASVFVHAQYLSQHPR